jgi:hypothetical protein
MEVSGQIHNLAALFPRKNPWYSLKRVWTGIRTGLDILENIKIPCHCLEFGLQIIQSIAKPLLTYLLTYSN